MKADDFIEWLNFKSIEQPEFFFYIDEISRLKNNNNCSNTIAVRTFLKDKSDILLQFLDEYKEEIIILPNFIQFLMVHYFRENIFSATHYLLKYKLNDSYIKKLEKEVSIFIEYLYKNKMYESICYFFHYPDINRIITRVKPLEQLESVNIHSARDEDFKKFIKLIKITNF